MNSQILLHFLRRFRVKQFSSVMMSVKLHQSHSSINFNCCRSPLLRNQKLGANLLLSAGILSMFSKDEETAEDKLITNIKRSILCIQRGEHHKAEQMLHLALRMAQDLQNKDGITFIFDVMANLAMEQGEYSKAEKLFVTVMQRLLADGYAQHDIKVRVLKRWISSVKPSIWLCSCPGVDAPHQFENSRN